MHQESSSATRSAALPYNTGWVANTLSWSNREDIPFRFAVGSFTHEYQNTIDIVQKYDNDLVCRASFAHCYPPTKLMFSPAKTSSGSDLLISTADYLRLWEVKECVEGKDMKEKDLPENQEAADHGDGVKGKPEDETVADASPAALEKKKKSTINSQVTMKKMFDAGKPNDFCSPITSCDWNADDPEVVGCCSIDTTVTIWNIEQGVHTMQLIAHDKEVYDIAFAKGTHTFASCGADGSVRIFDLRDMEHCTIVYETPELTPLLRVAWNKHDQHYLSTFGINGTDVVIIDIRYPTTPIATLTQGHRDAINCINWAPHSSQYMCSGGEDCIANIWDLSNSPKDPPSRYLTYDAPAPINNISWSAQHEEYIVITAGEQAQLLKI